LLSRLEDVDYRISRGCEVDHRYLRRRHRETQSLGRKGLCKGPRRTTKTRKHTPPKAKDPQPKPRKDNTSEHNCTAGRPVTQGGRPHREPRESRRQDQANGDGEPPRCPRNRRCGGSNAGARRVRGDRSNIRGKARGEVGRVGRVRARRGGNDHVDRPQRLTPGFDRAGATARPRWGGLGLGGSRVRRRG